jgi:hypothetical protein
MHATRTLRFVVVARFTESRTRRRGRRAVRTRRLPVGLVYGRRFRNRRASASTIDEPPARADLSQEGRPEVVDHIWSRPLLATTFPGARRRKVAEISKALDSTALAPALQ